MLVTTYFLLPSSYSLQLSIHLINLLVILCKYVGTSRAQRLFCTLTKFNFNSLNIAQND